MQDLLDLDFDETRTNSGPSLRPSKTSASTSTRSGGASGAGGSGAQHGSLSDYSDYDDESSDEETHQHRVTAGTGVPAPSRGLAPPGDSPSLLSPAHSGSTTQSQHGAALEAWRRSNKSRIGEETSSLWSKEDEDRWIQGGGGYEDEEAEADPFGDEWEEVAGKLRASGAETGRREWAAV